MTQQQREASLTEWIEETIDRTATSVEEVHKSIAAIPLDVMRSTGFFEQTADDVSSVQERSISAVYDVVRDVNRRVVGLASDLLAPHGVEPRNDSEQMDSRQS